MLIPDDMLKTIPALYSQENEGADAVAYVKLFTPDSNFTWYILEIDDDNNLCFGYVVSHFSEYGYFTLLELESLKGPLNLNVERDIYFEPTKMDKLLKLHNEQVSWE